jgi:predicted DNA-binding transcriptional regulator AlpA
MPFGSASLLISGPPISGESFFGYILRLTQWNSYNRMSWILNRAGIGLGGETGWGVKQPSDLMSLARLIGTDLTELVSLMNWGPDTYLKKTELFFGNCVSQYRIRETHPKLCATCLVEKNYHRRIWDLAYVTCCPTHQCLLIDHCPNCSKRISWARRHVSICGCDYDWRKAIPIPTTRERLKLTRMVFTLCGIPIPTDDGDLEADENNPLLSLGLEDLLSAVTFMSAQSVMLSDASGKHSLVSRNTEQLNEFFSRGVAVFEEWPGRYYEFLTQRRAIREKASVPSRVNSVFSSFVRMLNRSFSSEELKFMYIAFEHYLKEHWDSGILNREALRFTGADPHSKRYLAKNEVIKYLGTTEDWVDKFVEEGRLKIIPIVGSGNKATLFRRSEVDELKEYLTQLLTIPDVVKHLGICSDKVMDLTRQGCLAPVYQPGVNGWRWLFSRTDIAELFSRIESKIIPPFHKTERLLTLKDAIPRLNCQIDIGAMVRAVLEDKLAPSGKVPGVGLHQFLFSERVLRAFMSTVQQPAEDQFTPHQVAKRFRVRAGNIYLCINEGLLAAELTPKTKRTLYRITKGAIVSSRHTSFARR